MSVAPPSGQTDVVGEMDWLERGHGGGDGLQPMIKGTVGRAADRVSIRSVLRGGEVRAPRKPRRRTKALVGWLLYCCTAIGGTAAAFTVRDTLFPQLGGPSQALWVSPAPEVPSTTEHSGSSTEGGDTVPLTIDVAIVAAAEAEAAGPVAFDTQTVPSASSPDADQAVVDNHGPTANAGPSTGTSVDGGPGGGHGTIVDETPTNTASGPGSSSVDPTTTTASTPGSPEPTTTTTPDGDGGKGGGGGGGGGGSGGGGGGGGGGSDGGRTTVPPTTP